MTENGQHNAHKHGDDGGWFMAFLYRHYGSSRLSMLSRSVTSRDAPLHEHGRYVYGLAAGGSFGICCLINVMSQKEGHP